MQDLNHLKQDEYSENYNSFEDRFTKFVNDDEEIYDRYLNEEDDELNKALDLSLQTHDYDDDEDEELNKILELSLKDDDYNRAIELSKHNNIDLFREEMQLEVALKISKSFKQPEYQRPVGKIYQLDDIFKDLLLNVLIKRGCLKDIYAFCTTRWYYYHILKRERYHIHDKLINLKQIHPSNIKFKIHSFEEEKWFELKDGLGNTLCTKQYYVVANSDSCGCLGKNCTLYIKIPVGNEHIIVGRYGGWGGDPILRRCTRSHYFNGNCEGKLELGTAQNQDATMLLNSCVHDIRCDEILTLGY